MILLPQEIDARNELDLAVPVEVPQLPAIVTARLDVFGCSVGPGEAQFAPVNSTLLGEVTLRYSRHWAHQVNDSIKDDENDITYELHADSDVWLLGGQRKAHFSAKVESPT